MACPITKPFFPSLVYEVQITDVAHGAQGLAGNWQGAIFHHLRVSRRLISLILDHPGPSRDPGLFNFLVENYAYLTSVNNITFNLSSTDRLIMYDAAIYETSSWKEGRAYGAMFGYASTLLGLIPQIAQFGRHCGRQSVAQVHGVANQAQYRELEFRIQRAEVLALASPEAAATPGLHAALQLYREALLIWLHASMYIHEVAHAEFLSQLDCSVQRAGGFMETLRHFSARCSVRTTLLWPVLMVGSCLRSPTSQESLENSLRNGDHNVPNVTGAIELLRGVWDGPSDEIFGPYGLELVMKRRGVSFCLG